MKQDTNNSIKEAVAYFSTQHVYKKLFSLFREKVESFGRIGGTVKLDLFKDEELEPIALFYGTVIQTLKKKKTLSLASFEKQLQLTKFEGIELHKLLEAYFEEPIKSKKIVQEQKRQQEQEKLVEITELYPSLSSYFSYLSERNNDSYWIVRMVLTDEFQKAIQIMDAANTGLPKSYERLPFFSQRISGNPHTFDLTTLEGKLLIHLLHFKLYGKGSVPSNTEAVNEILLNFGVLRDDITNFVSFANLLGEQKGMIHPVWQAAVDTKNAVNMPLRELLKIDKVTAVSRMDVYIVENSGVFSSLLDLVPDASLVCTHGQFKLAGLRLIDLLVEAGYKLYYSGDFDPEGVAMAVRLLERHPKHIQLWRMDLVDYHITKPSVDLGDRFGKLKNINHPQVAGLVGEMSRIKKVGYQEALLEKMAEDLRLIKKDEYV